MALTRAELDTFQETLERAGRPVIFYDNDADGLTSYLLAARKNPDAHGVRGARGPELDLFFTRKIDEFLPDQLFILDKPRVTKEFFDEVQTPTVWLDHHDPTTQEPGAWSYEHLTYLNPRLHNDRDRRPVSYWVWRAVGGPVWLATIGSVADWSDTMLQRFADEHPALAPDELTVKQALYDSPLGTLVQMFNFLLKGRSREVKRRVNALSRIESPEELLEKQSPRAKYLWRQYEPVLEEYERQREQAMQTSVEDGLYVHVYGNLRTSLVAEVANEVLVTKDADVLIVGRRVNSDVKFSMRSHKKRLPPIVEKALDGVDGYGGGHREACGGSIKAKDWERFIENVKAQL